MTASAPKPAYQFEDLEPSNAEPFAPEPAPDFADDQEAHPDQWHELPCHVDTELDDPEQQRIEDLHASFHEQLTVLVRALESGDESTSDVGEVSRHAEPELADVHEAGAKTMSDADDEDWRAAPGLMSLATLQTVLSGRARGFALGLGASIAVGAIVLMFASGSGGPPVAASSSAQSEPEVVSAPAASEAAEVQLRASLLDRAEPRQTTIADAVRHSGSSETDVGGDEPTADIAAAVPGLVIEPAARPEQNDQRTTIIPPARDAAGVAAPAPELEHSDTASSEAPADVAINFETIVQTTTENEPASEHTDQPGQLLASAHPPAETAHVVKYANMRAGPDNSAAVLAVLPEGSPVEVVQCDQWCEVISDGQRGWVYKDLLSGATGG